jgi:hypothetical protein
MEVMSMAQKSAIDMTEEEAKAYCEQLMKQGEF